MYICQLLKFKCTRKPKVCRNWLVALLKIYLDRRFLWSFKNLFLISVLKEFCWSRFLWKLSLVVLLLLPSLSKKISILVYYLYGFLIEKKIILLHYPLLVFTPPRWTRPSPRLLLLWNMNMLSFRKVPYILYLLNMKHVRSDDVYPRDHEQLQEDFAIFHCM